MKRDKERIIALQKQVSIARAALSRIQAWCEQPAAVASYALEEIEGVEIRNTEAKLSEQVTP